MSNRYENASPKRGEGVFDVDEREVCAMWMANMPDLDYGLMAIDYLISLEAGTTLTKDGIESFTDWALANRCPKQVLSKAA